MLKNISLKKEYLLIAGAIVAVLICYQLAFKKTIEAWQVNKQLNSQLKQATDLSVQPAYLGRKNSNLSKIITLYKTDTTAFRSNVISNIAGIAEKENVRLSEVPLQDPLYHTDKFIIERLDFEGDFFALTKVLYALQNTPEIGMLRSFDYRITDIRPGITDGTKLVTEIYLEQAR